MKGPAGETGTLIVLGFISGSLAWAVSTKSPMFHKEAARFSDLECDGWGI